MRICLSTFRGGVTSAELSGEMHFIETLAYNLFGKGVDLTLLGPITYNKYPFNQVFYSSCAYSDKTFPVMIPFFVKQARRLAEDYDVFHCFLQQDLAFLGNLVNHNNNVIVNFTSIASKKYPQNFLSFSCRKYIVASNYQANMLSRYTKSIEVIPNVIDLKRYKDAKRSETATYHVSYLGHFTHQKGVEYLVEAFPLVLKEFPEAKLFLAYSGHGPKRKIEKLIKNKKIEDHVVWTGRTDVTSFLSQTDVLVLPYTSTRGTMMFPNVILESLATGTPLVTSRLRPLTEIIKDKETGMLVSPADPTEIANAVTRLFSDEKLRRKISRQQKECAKSFDVDVIVSRYTKLYEEVV